MNNEQNNTAAREVEEKISFLIDVYKKHSSDWGIGKTINNIYSFMCEQKEKLNKDNDYDIIKKECNEEISKYIEFFNDKYESYYGTKRYLNPDIDIIKNKYKTTTSGLDEIEKNMNHFLANHNKRNEGYVPMVKNASIQMKVDKEKLSNLYQALLVEINKINSLDSFVTVIMDISFLKLWFNFIKTCNYLISSRKSIYNKAISAL